MVKSAYIHIPFCKQKCNYCSFVSFAKPELIADYIVALKSEIKHFYKGETLNTLYFGGGTPSLLNVTDFEEILELFSLSEETEITAELNPENLTEGYLSGLKKFGINRLSLGCQTFDEEILRVIGRKHSALDVENAVKIAQNAGFDNISLDFIYGLPNQTIKSFADDLIRAKSLGIQHVSLYGLKVEEGSTFYKNMPENLADDDLQVEMYLKAIEILSDFEHYEISNFSRIENRNLNSKHNLNYWNNENYYGFGVAAHGYVESTRYNNSTSLEEYLKNPLARAFENQLRDTEKLEEEIFLGFRKIGGINIKTIEQKFGINFEKKFDAVLKKYIESGHLVKKADNYQLSIAGILVSNYILSEFLD